MVGALRSRVKLIRPSTGKKGKGGVTETKQHKKGVRGKGCGHGRVKQEIP
jgi:hypothetical protein